jgi:LmbE family N-acetylglucosaminyl deacetylase
MGRVIAFSPHLDDAVFSAGARLGGLASAGADVAVVTLFAGLPEAPFSPAARELHARCGLSDAEAMATRRDEDVRAMACLGLRPGHEDILDAAYRRRPDGSWLIGAGQPPWGDQALVDDELEVRLTETVQAAIDAVVPDLVLTCAAIGGHVDHVLARDAVIRAVGGAGIGIGLELWEDLPYGLSARRMPPLPGPVSAGSRRPEGATDTDWARKYQAMECYASQLAMLWPDGQFRDQLRRHERALAAGGPTGRAEAFWQVSARPG